MLVIVLRSLNNNLLLFSVFAAMETVSNVFDLYAIWTLSIDSKVAIRIISTGSTNLLLQCVPWLLSQLLLISSTCMSQYWVIFVKMCNTIHLASTFNPLFSQSQSLLVPDFLFAYKNTLYFRNCEKWPRSVEILINCFIALYLQSLQQQVTTAISHSCYTVFNNFFIKDVYYFHDGMLIHCFQVIVENQLDWLVFVYILTWLSFDSVIE
jgi:hypothetical protein